MPASALRIGTLEPRRLSERAALLAEIKLGRRAISKTETYTALTVISAMYCRQALTEPVPRLAQVNGFACDSIVSENAIRAEIARALPHLNPAFASTIYLSLVRALDESFTIHKFEAVRLAGFGMFTAAGNHSFEYQLTFDLPVQEYVKSTLLPPQSI